MFQSLFIVFQGNASRVHPDTGLGLVPVLGSGLALTASENQPLSATRGLAAPCTAREHRVITANENISPCKMIHLCINTFSILVPGDPDDVF